MAQIADARMLFTYKLGLALGMERKVLTMLGKLEQTATRDELKQGFARHREETDQQIRNLEKAMQAMGVEEPGHQDTIAAAIDEHGEEMLGRVDEALADSVLLGGAAETEHHEISIYEALITMAGAMGEEDVVALLQENLEQEKSMLHEVEGATQKLAQQAAQQV
jgi:ferritin-like metal-binding protein YciE